MLNRLIILINNIIIAQSLKIIAWNANELSQYMNEVNIFILNNQICIMLISESHFTKKHYFKIPCYLIYHAYSGTVIIIFGFVDVTFVYCSPKHIIISKQFEAFFVMLGDRFTAVSDYNQQTSIQDPD